MESEKLYFCYTAIEWTAIGTIVLAAATIALSACTIALLVVGIKQLIVARRAELRERADLHAIEIRYWEGNEFHHVAPISERPLLLVFEIKVRNYGKSQAKNILIEYSVKVSAGKDANAFQKATKFSKTTAIAKPIFEDREDAQVFTASISEADATLLNKNWETHAVYVFGRLTFADAIGKCTPTNFFYVDNHRYYASGKGPLFQFPSNLEILGEHHGGTPPA